MVISIFIASAEVYPANVSINLIVQLNYETVILHYGEGKRNLLLNLNRMWH